MQRVDTSQFRNPSSAGEGSNVIHPPQDQLTVDGVGVMKGPCSCITKLLPANAKVTQGQNSSMAFSFLFLSLSYTT